MRNKIAASAVGGMSEATKRLNPHLFEPERKEPKATSGKRLRQSAKPVCNSLEAEWGQELAHTNPGARPQAVRLNLANGINYTPDWVDLTVHPVKAWECKGPHSFRGGFENLKVAAAKYQEIKFTLIWKDGGEWKRQEILP